MLSDFTGADKVYIACGYTDLRRGIDGLASMVQQQFQLDQMVMDNFAYLLNEAEAWDAASVEVAPKGEKKPRKRRSGSLEEVIPEGTPVEVIEHRLSEEE